MMWIVMIYDDMMRWWSDNIWSICPNEKAHSFEPGLWTENVALVFRVLFQVAGKAVMVPYLVLDAVRLQWHPPWRVIKVPALRGNVTPGKETSKRLHIGRLVQTTFQTNYQELLHVATEICHSPAIASSRSWIFTYVHLSYPWTQDMTNGVLPGVVGAARFSR